MDNENYQIKKIEGADLPLFKDLITLFNSVFEVDGSAIASDTHLANLLSKKEFIVFAALQNGEIIGGITAYEMQMYSSDHSEIYIYDVAVRQDIQRIGVGKKLLLSLNKYSEQNNIKTMFVEAHEEDKHAIDFYHSARGNLERVAHFSFKINSSSSFIFKMEGLTKAEILIYFFYFCLMNVPEFLSGKLKVVNSTYSDIDFTLSLFASAVKYQEKNGYELWPQFSKQLIETEITEQRHWKILDGETIVCVFSIMYNDPVIWKEKDDEPSVYLHRIAVNPLFKGKGIMKLIKGWAIRHAREKDKKYVRMDT